MSTKPSIVFAHGLWADGSCYSKVMKLLQADGYEVISTQNQLNTVEDDAAAVRIVARPRQKPLCARRSFLRRERSSPLRGRTIASGLWSTSAPLRRTKARPRRPSRKASQDTGLRPCRGGRRPTLAEAIGNTAISAATCPKKSRRSVWATQTVPAGRPVQPAGAWRGVEDEADLLHRRGQRPDRASRARALRRQADEREGHRASVEPRPDAVAAAARLRGDR